MRRCGGRAKEGRPPVRAHLPLPPPPQWGRAVWRARAPAHLPGSAPRPAARSRPRAEATQSRSPTQRRWRRRQRRGPGGRSARDLRAHLPHPGHRPGRPPAGLRWRRRQRRSKAAAPSGKRRKGHRRSTSDLRTVARLGAGPWLPGALTCPKRIRGDAATRSARPPVLPPPPRPPQRRSRHLVSRAGTRRCACVGTASEGPRRCRAAILSVAGPAGSSDPVCFRPPPLSLFCSTRI